MFIEHRNSLLKWEELQITIKRYNIIHATLLKASMFYKH